MTKRTIADIPIFEYDQVDSTQDVARELIDSGEITQNVKQGLCGVLRASYQTNGRGRLNREWKCEPDSALLATFVIKKTSSEPMVDVSRVLVATCKYLSTYTDSIGIKWPNDLVDKNTGYKIAGCLGEVYDGYLLIGLGLNILQSSYPKSTNIYASSLEEYSINISPTELIETLVSNIIEFDKASDEEIFSVYRHFNATMGKKVRIEMIDSNFVGYASDIDSHGAIILRDDDGKSHVFRVGDIIHLRSGE